MTNQHQASLLAQLRPDSAQTCSGDDVEVAKPRHCICSATSEGGGRFDTGVITSFPHSSCHGRLPIS